MHWYKSDSERRLHLAKTVGTLRVDHVCAVGRGHSPRTERARRKCLELLLPHLEGTGANEVLLESRQQRNNKHDIDMVDACRRKRIIGEGMHVGFRLPNSEPLLWLADVVCGATLAAERGDRSYFEQFGDSTTILDAWL